MKGRGRAAIEQAGYKRRIETWYEQGIRLKRMGRQMTVMDGGEQKRLLKEKIRGSVRKTERTILRVDLLSAAAQAGRDFVMGAYFGDAGQEPEMNLEG
jgi:hypothetical protein